MDKASEVPEWPWGLEQSKRSQKCVLLGAKAEEKSVILAEVLLRGWRAAVGNARSGTKRKYRREGHP